MENKDLERSGRQGRHAWLDHARGIGIILVVYAHQLRAQAAIGQVPASWNGPLQDSLIYSFHMPLFFFISGIVSVKSLRTKPFAVSFLDKMKYIAYPYFLWSFVSWCLSALAIRYVNTPMDFRNLVSIFYAPILQYWFLYILFFCQVLALVLKRVFVANIVIVGLLVLVPLPFINPTINEFVMSFPFFVIGMVLSGRLLAPTIRLPRRWELTAALVVLALFVALTCLRPGNIAPPTSAALARTWMGIAFVVIISRIIGPRWRGLSALGQASMAIFVMHTIVAAALRTTLGIIGFNDSLAMLVCCVMGGLFVPLIFVRIAAMYDLDAWLGLGKATRRITSADRSKALGVS